MGKVYQSVRGVVQEALLRRKPDLMASAQARSNDTSSNDAMEEIERLLLDGIRRLRAAVRDDQAVAASEVLRAEQVIDALRMNIADLENKLEETADAVQRKGLASQEMEENLNIEIRGLQSAVKQKEEDLEARDQEVSDLNSKVDLLTEQATHLEAAIQQAKEEAEREAQRGERVIEGLKAQIAQLETKLGEMEATVQGKDLAARRMEERFSTEIRDLEALVKKKEEVLQSRDNEVNTLKSQLDALTEQTTHLEATIGQAKEEAAHEAQRAEQNIVGLKANVAELEIKLRETKESIQRREIASQQAEESLNIEIGRLQSAINQKEEELQGREREVNELNSKIDVLTEQKTQLEAAIQQAKHDAATDVQRAGQMIDSLRASIADLENKLGETQEAVQRKEIASRQMEERLDSEIRDLQDALKNKDESLETRGRELNDLKSKLDASQEQAMRLDAAIQQTRGKAASESQLKPQGRSKQVIGEEHEPVKGRGRGQNRQVTDPSAESQLRGNSVNEAKALTDVQAHNIGIGGAGEQWERHDQRPPTSRSRAGGIPSIQTDAAGATLSPSDFERIVAEFSDLANVIKNIASLVARDHVKTLGESMEEFPQTRLGELLESLSREIPDKKLKAEFHRRLGNA